jgi:hypothetical protein
METLLSLKKLRLTMSLMLYTVNHPSWKSSTIAAPLQHLSSANAVPGAAMERALLPYMNPVQRDTI